MAKKKRPTWWKIFSHQRAAIESVPDEEVGRGFKAALRYFDGEEVTPAEMDLPAFMVFCMLRPNIDAAMQEFERAVQSGKKGANNRWGNTE